MLYVTNLPAAPGVLFLRKVVAKFVTIDGDGESEEPLPLAEGGGEEDSMLGEPLRRLWETSLFFALEGIRSIAFRLNLLDKPPGE